MDTTKLDLAHQHSRNTQNFQTYDIYIPALVCSEIALSYHFEQFSTNNKIKIIISLFNYPQKIVFITTQNKTVIMHLAMKIKSDKKRLKYVKTGRHKFTLLLFHTYLFNNIKKDIIFIFILSNF